MKTTTLESTILQAIAQNEMNSCNYGVPENATDTHTWVDSLDACQLREGQTFPEAKSIPGIVASLSKKGLVSTDGKAIGLTELGFEIWKAEYFA